MLVVSNTITPLNNKPYCQVVLPLVYDDALSYYESLCQVRAKINEVIDYTQGLLDEAKTYTDEKYSVVETKLTEKIDTSVAIMEKEISDTRTQLFSDFSNLEKNLTDSMNKKFNEQDVRFNQLEAKIEKEWLEIQKSINELYNVWELYQVIYDKKLADMYKEMQDYVDTHIASITQLYVVNPLTDKLEDINVVLKDIANAFNIYGLTAREYDNLRLTAKEYDNMGLTAMEHDYRFRLKLFDRLYVSMQNPFTGFVDSISNVVNMLANLHRNALTCDEYDDKQLEAEVYDGLEISAYDFDFNSKALVV